MGEGDTQPGFSLSADPFVVNDLQSPERLLMVAILGKNKKPATHTRSGQKYTAAS